MSAQIIEFPMHRIRPVRSDKSNQVAPKTVPEVRPSIRIARRLIAWTVLVIAAYLLFFGQASAVQPAEANNSGLTNSSIKNFTYVTVMSGDSLWAIAERYAAGRDPRDFIQDVVTLNNLSDTVVSAGMKLAIPRS
jgi:hypothetical protein